ncbi:Smr domain protein [Penicillium brasilianum]|uniref:Smr domain protein n=1 Tax=Penicillium brasilianum TaxID=104259 RepID=A0A1S9RAB7_PENBI|nr:Smr domain protein [Penicillium brasilianum]
MSYQMSHLGPRAFNHDQSSDAEQEYDRLRDLARQEASKRGDCYSRSKEAYASGDGARAKQLSEEGKAHGRKMEEYNKQASEFIFRENNASGRVADDTIDLHGQFVEEAEEILEERIKYAKAHGQNHLHVYVATFVPENPAYALTTRKHITNCPPSIVGKGNHSAGHIQKIKPRVEQVCKELGLQYATEDNAGRIYVNLTGGEAVMPSYPSHQAPHHGGGGQSYPGHQQQQHHQQQQQHQQQPQQQDEIEKVVNALLPKVMRKLEKACCVVM